MMERMAGIASAAPESIQPPLPQAPVPTTGTDDAQADEEMRRIHAARTEEPSPDFAAYKEAQKQLVEQYKLPYDLPGSTTKVLHIEDLVTMKGGGKGRPPKKPGDNSPRTHGAVENWRWRNADMIMSRGGDSSSFDTNIYGHWSHAGIYYSGWNNIIDAFPNVGVRISSWDWWQGGRYKELGAFAIKSGMIDPYLLPDIARTATPWVGRPYAWMTDKFNETYWYCSKVLFKAYRYYGIDLDSTGGYWVTPDDIAEHPSVGQWRYSRL
jgi:hypothetical protein